MSIYETKPTTKRLHRVRRLDPDHGDAVLYRISKINARAFDGYDTYFIIHAVEETRYTYNLKPMREDTRTRYHAWSVENGPIEEMESEPKPHMVEKDDIAAPNIEEAAKKYLRQQ